MSLHRQNSSLSDHLGFGVARCGHGDLNVEALQQVVAAKWAVDVINAQSGPEDLKIGKLNSSIVLPMEVAGFWKRVATKSENYLSMNLPFKRATIKNYT